MEIQSFLDELASDSPAPGGGSVAALCGSLAAALVSMVCSLTIGKEKYRESWAVMEGIKVKSEALRAKFVTLMNEDTESFNIFMAAMKMPKTTDEEKAARRKAMGEASKTATEIPLRTLEACAELSAIAVTAAERGNPNTASDAGSAAAYNVRINLPGISDEVFADACRARMSEALDEISRCSKNTSDLMGKMLG